MSLTQKLIDLAIIVALLIAFFVTLLMACRVGAQDPATVIVYAQEPSGVISGGSGVLVNHLDDGRSVVLTAAHVIAGTHRVWLGWPGWKDYTWAKISGVDTGADLAALTLRNKKVRAIAPVPLVHDGIPGNSQLEFQGYPGGRFWQVRSKITSASWRKTDGTPLFEWRPAVNSGASGGPLYAIHRRQRYLVAICSGSDGHITVGAQVRPILQRLTRWGLGPPPCWGQRPTPGLVVPVPQPRPQPQQPVPQPAPVPDGAQSHRVLVEIKPADYDRIVARVLKEIPKPQQIDQEKLVRAILDQINMPTVTDIVTSHEFDSAVTAIVHEYIDGLGIRARVRDSAGNDTSAVFVPLSENKFGYDVPPSKHLNLDREIYDPDA